MKLSLCATIAAITTVATAHGHTARFTANGRTWDGPVPNTGSDMDSPIRVIRTLEPITSFNSNDMTCGIQSQPARAIAQVTAGSTVQFDWRAGPNGTWPHPYGPSMMYAFKCRGSARDCQPGRQKGWAKIGALGLRNDGSWFMTLPTERKPLPFKIPENMPNGDYLFRHELIALHVATSRGPEFYVSCTQVRIVGGQDSSLSLADLGADLVSFPGGYTNSMSGLYANVFGGVSRQSYKMPGPRPFNPRKAGPATSTSTAQNFAPTSRPDGKRCQMRGTRLESRSSKHRRFPHRLGRGEMSH